MNDNLNNEPKMNLFATPHLTVGDSGTNLHRGEITKTAYNLTWVNDRIAVFHTWAESQKRVVDGKTIRVSVKDVWMLEVTHREFLPIGEDDVFAGKLTRIERQYLAGRNGARVTVATKNG